MRKNAPTDVSMLKNFPEVIPEPPYRMDDPSQTNPSVACNSSLSRIMKHLRIRILPHGHMLPVDLNLAFLTL